MKNRYRSKFQNRYTDNLKLASESPVAKVKKFELAKTRNILLMSQNISAPNSNHKIKINEWHAENNYMDSAD
jgi:hypothetical protein